MAKYLSFGRVTPPCLRKVIKKEVDEIYFEGMSSHPQIYVEACKLHLKYLKRYRKDVPANSALARQLYLDRKRQYIEQILNPRPFLIASQGIGESFVTDMVVDQFRGMLDKAIMKDFLDDDIKEVWMNLHKTVFINCQYVSIFDTPDEDYEKSIETFEYPFMVEVHPAPVYPAKLRLNGKHYQQRVVTYRLPRYIINKILQRLDNVTVYSDVYKGIRDYFNSIYTVLPFTDQTTAVQEHPKYQKYTNDSLF